MQPVSGPIAAAVVLDRHRCGWSVPTSRMPRAGRLDQLRQAKPVAYLDHLSSADDDSLARLWCRARSRSGHEGSGTVVHEARASSAAGIAAWSGQPTPARPRLRAFVRWPEVELDVDVTGRGHHRRDRRVRQRRPTEIGVHAPPRSRSRSRSETHWRRRGGSSFQRSRGRRRQPVRASPSRTRLPGVGPGPSSSPRSRPTRLTASDQFGRRPAGCLCGVRAVDRLRATWRDSSVQWCGLVAHVGGDGRESNPPSRATRLHRF